VNWDASLNPKEKCIRVGIVARESRGEFMGAQYSLLLLDTDPRTAESLATLYVIMFSKSFGLLEVVFEGNASQVIFDINSPLPHFSKVGQFTKSVISESKDLRFVSFVHPPRESNEVAHVLAKTAIVRKLMKKFRIAFPI